MSGKKHVLVGAVEARFYAAVWASFAYTVLTSTSECTVHPAGHKTASMHHSYNCSEQHAGE